MPSKIMLVIDNKEDQEFLEKVLVRLKYAVISMKNGVDLSEQLIDHFPDVVFASTLGRNAKILNALGKIKEVRGKPKLVFVKLKNEKNTLTNVQKEIIDGTLYSPIDPFKLIDLLAHTTELDKIELRRRYNEMLQKDRGGFKKPGASEEDAETDVSDAPSENPLAREQRKNQQKDYGSTQVMGRSSKKATNQISNESPEFYGTVEMGEDAEPSPSTQEIPSKETFAAEPNPVADQASSDSLINDPVRQKKYQELAEKFKKANGEPKPIDIQKLREKQKAQAQEISEDPKVKLDRKHFLKTLFSISPKSVIKKD